MRVTNSVAGCRVHEVHKEVGCRRIRPAYDWPAARDSNAVCMSCGSCASQPVAYIKLAN